MNMYSKKITLLKIELMVPIFFLLSIMVGMMTGYKFLPDHKIDGFASQLQDVKYLIDNDLVADWYDNNLLFIIHVIRYISVIPFLYMEERIWDGGALFLILFLILPILKTEISGGKCFINGLPLFMPLLVSGRSALVAIGIAYVFIFLFFGGSSVLMLLGFFFINLSSASSIAGLMLMISLGTKNILSSERRMFYWIIIFILIGLTSLSAYDKYYGVLNNLPGYESNTASGNFLIDLMSRNNIVQNFIDGQYFKSFIYFSMSTVYMLLLFLFMIVGDFLKLKILLAIFPCVIFEGVGLISTFFLMYWLFFNFKFKKVTIK